MNPMIDILGDINKYSNFVVKLIDPKSIVFEERVKLMCFGCPKYGEKNTCPPNLPNLPWEKIVSEYENGLLIVFKQNFDSITSENRNESSIILDDALNYFLRILWDNNCPFAVAFGGGSCKRCENCSEKCISGRIPLEAIGVNVIATAKVVDIDVVFPPINYFYRIGLLLW